MSGRYRVDFPADVGFTPGSADDLNDAGRIFLATPGATDIYDTKECRYLDPLTEVPVVAEDWERWHAAQPEPDSSEGHPQSPSEGSGGSG